MLSSIPEVLSVKFGIDINPGFRGCILVFLEIGNHVTNDNSKVIVYLGVLDKTLSPDDEAGRVLFPESRLYKSKNKPSKLTTKWRGP